LEGNMYVKEDNERLEGEDLAEGELAGLSIRLGAPLYRRELKMGMAAVLVITTQASMHLIVSPKGASVAACALEALGKH
jgi:hypothetical protein